MAPRPGGSQGHEARCPPRSRRDPVLPRVRAGLLTEGSMEYLVAVLIVFVVLLLSIGLHEIGHMVPAKRFGVRVSHYMVGFGPTLWSRTRGETEYGVKAIPLGGYVRLVGMYPPDAAVGNPPARTWLGRLAHDARLASAEEIRPGEDARRLLPPVDAEEAGRDARRAGDEPVHRLLPHGDRARRDRRADVHHQPHERLDRASSPPTPTRRASARRPTRLRPPPRPASNRATASCPTTARRSRPGSSSPA